MNGYQLTKENAAKYWAKVEENRKTYLDVQVEVRVIGGLPNGEEEQRLAVELNRLFLQNAPLVGDAQTVFGSGEFDLETCLNEACANIGIPCGLHQASVKHHGRTLRV